MITAGVCEGDVLAVKYRVERVLGAGGMGIVVAAHHLQLETKVALKFLLPHMVDNEDAVRRFEREARAAAKIRSEHVARTLDVGVLDNGAPYMVMEFLEGEDLARRLATNGPMGIEQAVEVVLQACEALAEAHSLGIVHRDLKPANLFWVDQPDGLPCIKVLDFGISKFTTFGGSASDKSMTLTASRMGSPLYMSPEQMVSARNVDARTDLWALGIILHELLTGEDPFHGETLPEVCLKIATMAPPPLRKLRPDAPVGLEAVILRCLEKDRERRYPDVPALAVALSPFGSPRCSLSIDRITRTPRQSGTLSPSPASFDWGDPRLTLTAETIGALGNTTTPRPQGRAYAAWALAAGIALALSAVIGVLAMKRAPLTETAASPAAVALPAALEPAGALPPSRAPLAPSPTGGVRIVLEAPSAAVPEDLAPPVHIRSRTTNPRATAPGSSPGAQPQGVPSASPTESLPPAKDGDPFSHLRPM
ncbi:MAG: protein kinase [Myxococcota bacterium]|nr:protein kinase [Myxococcota bacterium]